MYNGYLPNSPSAQLFEAVLWTCRIYSESMAVPTTFGSPKHMLRDNFDWG
jgi:hypothetical protein